MSAYPRRLRRSVADRSIAGVCGGIGEYFDIDPTAVRVVYALASVLAVLSGIRVLLVILIYFVLWMLIPEREYY